MHQKTPKLPPRMQRRLFFEFFDYQRSEVQHRNGKRDSHAGDYPASGQKRSKPK